jgi:uncharacterized 2Fe-2S/4Fe-4S cluster protein (DUF4445 family)
MAEIILNSADGDRLVIHALPGESFRSILLREGVLIDFPCGGKGRCGKCRITVDPLPASGRGRELSLPEGMCLACQARLETDCRLSLSPGRPEVPLVAAPGAEEPGHHFAGPPRVRRRPVSVQAPSLADQRSDCERLLDALSEPAGAHVVSDKHTAGLGAAPQPLPVPPGLLNEISACLRKNQWQAEAVMDGDLLVRLDPPGGNPDGPPVGFAIDVGTTSVDISLHDAESGALLARRILPNRQSAYGADVITRTQAFQEEGEALRRAVLQSIGEGAHGLLAEQGIAEHRVVRSVLVGNPIMLHILYGINPQPLTVAPYIPLFAASLTCSPGELGFTFQTRGQVETLPLISAFVGADTLGMMLALDLENEAEVSLAVDIGTNGEIVLAGKGGLVTTSTAAGPAFEGAQISCGLRAVPGAVSSVKLFPDREPQMTVLGGGRPRGLCGSGLISCVAALLEARLLDDSGRLMEPGEVSEEGYRRLIIRVDGKPAVRLDRPDRRGRQSRLYVTQRDIRQFQLAKAAVRTGIDMLLAENGLKPAEIRRLRLAGNFGSGLEVRQAMRVGLIPELPVEKIDLVGNAALRGAALVLVSEDFRRRARALPGRCRFLELAGRADFQQRFIEALLF